MTKGFKQKVMTKGFEQKVMTKGFEQKVMTKGFEQKVMTKGFFWGMRMATGYSSDGARSPAGVRGTGSTGNAANWV